MKKNGLFPRAPRATRTSLWTQRLRSFHFVMPRKIVAFFSSSRIMRQSFISSLRRYWNSPPWELQQGVRFWWSVLPKSSAWTGLFFNPGVCRCQAIFRVSIWLRSASSDSAWISLLKWSLGEYHFTFTSASKQIASRVEKDLGSWGL